MKPRDLLWVAALMLLLLAVYTYPLVTAPGGLLPDHWDPRVFSWVMASNSHRLVHTPGRLLHGNALYPYGSTITYSEPLLTPLIVYAPVFWLTDNPVLAYNLTLLVFWALSGLTVVWLAHALTASRSAAVIAGVVFMLCPYELEYYLEFQMHLSFGMPIALLGWYRFLVTQRARPLWLTFGGGLLTAFGSIYYAVILMLALAAFALAYTCMRPGGWRRGAIWPMLGVAACSLVAVAPVAIPYLHTRAELGFERVLAQQPLRHSADLLTYLETRHTLVYSLGVRTEAETALFMGFVPLLLAVWALVGSKDGLATNRNGRRALAAIGGALLAFPAALWAAWRWAPPIPETNLASWLPCTVLIFLLLAVLLRLVAHGSATAASRHLSAREWSWILGFLALLFGVLSLGPYIQLAGRPLGPGIYPGLYALLPFLRVIRVFTRLGVMVTLAVALLASIGLADLQRRLPPVRARWLTWLAAVLILAEFYSGPLQYETVLWPPRNGIYERLASEDPPVVLVEVPIRSSRPDSHERVDADAMLHSTLHWQYLVNGVSGFIPALAVQITNAFQDKRAAKFSAARLLTLLRSVYPPPYLLVTDNKLLPREKAVWDALSAGSSIRPIQRDGERTLYQLQGTPEEGRILHRYMSFDLLSQRSQARWQASLRVGAPEVAAAWLDVSLNGSPIATYELTAAAQTRQLALPRPWLRAAPNRLDLAARYRVDPREDDAYLLSPSGRRLAVDLHAHAGTPAGGEDATVRLNGQTLTLPGPGFHLLVLDLEQGRIGATRRFPTHVSAAAGRKLRRAIRELAPGSAALLVSNGAALANIDDATARAFRDLGASFDPRAGGETAYVLLGVKGDPPGSALELIGALGVDATHGHPERDVRLRLEHFELLADR